MKRVLVPSLPSPDSALSLPDEEAHHLVQVLRIRNGEKIEALDGRGAKMLVEVELTGKGKAVIHARSEPVRDPSLMALPITLEMAVLKGDAMEWSVEKAVELGVRTFIPVLSAHAVVQVDRKGPDYYRERWQKIADQALKQCGRLERMDVKVPTPLETLMTEKRGLRLWADEASRAEAPHVFEALSRVESKERITQGVAILIGPEGGWSESERALLLRSACLSTSLGPWVYRAETAALFATSLVAASMR
ncbi:MAG: 16S rRNA (uracil(1498)-N(3))-methyltransferase [Cryobacterium sp.]|nr:16S rRNA (uracil(1498)-N(3))-methyltransferase [Oligoflexia bacterium]